LPSSQNFGCCGVEVGLLAQFRGLADDAGDDVADGLELRAGDGAAEEPCVRVGAH
jgi:hypothetical protein